MWLLTYNWELLLICDRLRFITLEQDVLWFQISMRQSQRVQELYRQ